MGRPANQRLTCRPSRATIWRANWVLESPDLRMAANTRSRSVSRGRRFTPNMATISPHVPHLIWSGAMPLCGIVNSWPQEAIIVIDMVWSRRIACNSWEVGWSSNRRTVLDHRQPSRRPCRLLTTPCALDRRSRVGNGSNYALARLRIPRHSRRRRSLRPSPDTNPSGGKMRPEADLLRVPQKGTNQIYRGLILRLGHLDRCHLASLPGIVTLKGW